MRHGQVSYFPRAGERVDPLAVHLTDEGQEQASLAGRELADVAFDRCVHSGLNRTAETAQLVLAGREVPTSTREDLQELRSDHAALMTAGGDLQAAFTQSFVRAREDDARFLHGERFVEAQQRVLGAWRALLAAQDWETLLVVAHGGVNRILIAHALGAGRDAYGSIEQEAGCINIIDVDTPDETYPGGRHIVRLMNHSPYDSVKRKHTLTTMERLWQGFTKMGSKA